MKKDDFNAETIENKNGANIEAGNLENVDKDAQAAELAAKQAANIINARYGQNRAAAIAALRPLFIHIRAEAAARAVLPKKSLPAETAKKELEQALCEMRDILISQATNALNARNIRVCGEIVVVIKDNDDEFEIDEQDLNNLVYKKDRKATAGSSLGKLKELFRAAAEKQALRDAERRAAADAKKAQKEPKVSNAEVLAAVKDGTLTVVKKIDANK